MRLDPNPLFRRAVTPWYDGTSASLVLMVATLMAIAFGAIGIDVARGVPDFQSHVWVPWLLLASAVLVFLSVTLRVVQRRLSERYGARAEATE
jgi:ABC-type Na+ efflux pump permease subunit